LETGPDAHTGFERVAVDDAQHFGLVVACGLNSASRQRDHENAPRSRAAVANGSVLAGGWTIAPARSPNPKITPIIGSTPPSGRPDRRCVRSAEDKERFTASPWTKARWGLIESSCPLVAVRRTASLRLSRVSTSLMSGKTKRWMAGPSLAMTSV